MRERVSVLPSHAEVIEQLIDERDWLRDVIRRSRPFLLFHLNPTAERIEGISRLRSEVDRLCGSWLSPEEPAAKEDTADSVAAAARESEKL